MNVRMLNDFGVLTYSPYLCSIASTREIKYFIHDGSLFLMFHKHKECWVSSSINNKHTLQSDSLFLSHPRSRGFPNSQDLHLSYPTQIKMFPVCSVSLAHDVFLTRVLPNVIQSQLVIKSRAKTAFFSFLSSSLFLCSSRELFRLRSAKTEYEISSVAEKNIQKNKKGNKST